MGVGTKTWTGPDGQLHGTELGYTSCQTSLSTDYIEPMINTIWDNDSILYHYSEPCEVKSQHCQCAIYDAAVQVLFWPVSVTYSEGKRLTISSTETGEKTIHYSGSILRSPTIYLHYKSIWTGGLLLNVISGMTSGIVSQSLEGLYGSYCTLHSSSRVYTDVILPVSLDVTLSSLYYGDVQISTEILDIPFMRHDTIATIQSLNFADLPPNLVPVSNWRRECSYYLANKDEADQVCATVFDQYYNPLVSVGR